MKKQQLTWICALWLTGSSLAVAAAALAEECAAPAADEQSSADPSAVPTPSEEAPPAEPQFTPGTVPQSQIDVYNKREEARKRRDEALKTRALNTQSGQ